MLVGLCGGICAGKSTVAQYFVEHEHFIRLYLAQHKRPNCTITCEQPAASVRDSGNFFDSVDGLLDFVTKNWEKRWVTTDIWDEEVLETLLRRPLFILVSVDAPLRLRWRRLQEKCHVRKTDPPTLEEFVVQSDDHLYEQDFGLAGLINSAEIRLVNQTSSLLKLHDTIKHLDLANEEHLRPSWDQYFMQLASLAAHRSNCMKRRVGCVLVRERRVISTGYNGTPRDLRNCNAGARCNSGSAAGVDLSTCLCIHAEENALLEAGRERIREGSILYCDTCPCLTCSIKITQVGISEVVYSQQYGMDRQAAIVFSEGGVKLRQFSPPRKGLIHVTD